MDRINQQNLLNAATTRAQSRVAATHGRAATGVKNEEEKKIEKPGDQVHISTPHVAEGEPAHEQPQAETRTQPDAAKAGANQARQETPYEKLDRLSEKMLNTIASNFSEEEQKELSARVEKAGVPPEGIIPALAENARDMALEKANQLAPNTSEAEKLEMAKTNPEMARLGRVAGSAQSFIQGALDVAQQRQGPTPGPNGPIPGQPGPGQPNGFGPGMPPGGMPPGGMPPGSSGVPGMPPGGMRPGMSDVELAQQMAQRKQEMEQVRTIWAETWAMMQKEMMKRWQLMQDTFTEISKIIMDVSVYRAQTFSRAAEAFDAYLRS
ncbi:MAG: hypothetical protein AB7S38_13625 [Vulcanimicrobiota bacterium]